MMNQITLVGRISKDLEITENKAGNKVLNLVLAVPRYFKNADGIYEIDFIPVKVYAPLLEPTIEYCLKGDLIGVTGRLQRVEDENLKVIAEKINFLATRGSDK